MNNREDARHATILAYLDRTTGGMFRGLMASSNYKGDFPALHVAKCIEIPLTPDLNEHTEQWQKLYRLFDDEWRSFVKGI